MKKELKLLKALADETRFNIIKFLLKGEKCVCEIFPHVRKTQSTVSIHLNNLEKTGILKSRKQGKKVFYSIRDKTVLEIFKIL